MPRWQTVPQLGLGVIHCGLSADGRQLPPAAQSAELADPATSGIVSDVWAGEIAGIADVESATTTITMPPADAEITAIYVPECALVGDLNGDGWVGQGDLDIVLDQWGRRTTSVPPITDPRADADNSGSVGQGDLDIVLAQWGDNCP